MQLIMAVSLERLRQDLNSARSAPRRQVRARILARAIANTLDAATMDEAERDALLNEIRALRRSYPADRKLAQLHAMTLANDSEEAVSSAIMDRNRQNLAELRTIVANADWKDIDISGYDLYILASIYLGLLQQQRYEEADIQIKYMAGLAFGGTAHERLEWLIAVRHGFWILCDQGQFERLESQIERAREF